MADTPNTPSGQDLAWTPEMDAFISPEVNGQQGGSAPTGDAAWTPEMDAFIEPELKEEKYGTAEQQVKAGLEGLAQGVAGPLAPMAEKALGVKEEDILGRAEVNPGTHFAGEAAGLVGPALLTGGESLLARATQAGVISKVGEEVAAKLGLGAAETLAGKIGAGAAKGAIDNMLLSGSDEVSRMILNDPGQSLGTAVTDIGLAGALGGALGAAGGAIGPLWKASVGDKASKVIEDFKGRINEHLTNPDPVSAMTDELSNYYKGIKEYADEVHGAAGLKAQNIAKAMPEMNEKIANQMSHFQGRLDEVLEHLEGDSHLPLLEDSIAKFKQGSASENPAEIFNAAQDLKQQLQEWGRYNKNITPLAERPFREATKELAHDLRMSLEDEAVWGKAAKVQKGINRALSGSTKGDIEEGVSRKVGYISALKDFEKKFTTEVAGERVIDPGKINTYLNQIGKPNAEIKQSMLKNFLDATEDYKKEIERLHNNLGLESPVINSPMNVTMKSLDQKTLGSKLADAFISKGLTTGGGEAIGGGVGAMLGHMTGMHGEIGAIIGQRALGPFFSSVLPSIARGVIDASNNATAFKSAIDYATAVAKGDALINTAAKSVFKSGSAILPQYAMPTDRDKAKLDKLLKSMDTDPGSVLDRTQLGHYMPNHGVMLGETAGRAASYINAMRPDHSKKAPLDSRPVASDAQKAKFNNALTIAQQPLAVLKKIQDGTINSDDLRALTSIYPELYTKLQTSLTQGMVDKINKGEAIPYSTRVGLSKFMGQPLDSTMNPMAIQGIQQGYMGAARQPAQQGPGTPNSKGVKSSPALQKMPGLYQTSDQARVQRANKQ